MCFLDMLPRINHFRKKLQRQFPLLFPVRILYIFSLLLIILVVHVYSFLYCPYPFLPPSSVRALPQTNRRRSYSLYTMNSQSNNNNSYHRNNTISNNNNSYNENWESIYDTYGCHAYQKRQGKEATATTSTTSQLNTSSCFIRIQGQYDTCVQDITSSEDIKREIHKIKQIQYKLSRHDEQQQQQDVEPYSRYWKEMNTSWNTDHIIPSKNNNTSTISSSLSTPFTSSSCSSSFSMLQWNMLAEGLSSGPHSVSYFSDIQTFSLSNNKSSSNNNHNKNHDKEDDFECMIQQQEQNNHTCYYGGFTEITNPELILDFTFRRWRLLEILLGYDVQQPQHEQQEDEVESSTWTNHTTRDTSQLSGLYDIIAVEEMDRFYGFFQPLLSILGYQGIFTPKPVAPGIKFGYYSDGCALFWKSDVFEYVTHTEGRYTIGNQVYVITLLRHISSQRVILVVVTHFKAKEGHCNEEIRYIQAIQLCEAIHEMIHEATTNQGCTSDRESKNIPIFIMGDFNSHPNTWDESIPTTSVEEVESDATRKCPKSCLDVFIQTSSEQPENLFSSAYPIHPIPDDFFTTWKIRGSQTTRRVIDYILHNGLHINGLHLSHILSIPCENELEPSRLPGFKYPSDHLALGAKFQIERLLD